MKKKFPASRAPAPDNSSTIVITDDDDRIPIDTGKDQWIVIQQISKALVDKCSGTKLFKYGNVLSEWDKDTKEIAVLNKDTFPGVVAKYCYTYSVSLKEGIKPGWPHNNVMRTILNFPRPFATLTRIARAPFVREDGSICSEQGYDEASTTILYNDEKLGKITVPDDPTQDEIEEARDLLIYWLYDFIDSFEGYQGLANALGLAITPFVRSLVPLSPLAVIDGLQYGSGKNKFIEAVVMLATGAELQTAGWKAEDDAENTKVLLSQFRTGKDIFVFDEAHLIQGNSIARCLTSPIYSERVLGVSDMAAYVNNVTCIAMGNQVNILGDMVRRVYRIPIYPKMKNPENRPNSSFIHPDIKKWTSDHRTELVEAILTLVRAWFIRGKSYTARPDTMGSFEIWEETVGGILQVAGIDGFLENTTAWRAETDYAARYTAEHVQWLSEKFGDKHFTAADATRLLKTDMNKVTLGGMEDTDSKSYVRVLGQRWAKIQGRWIGDLKLVRSEQRTSVNGSYLWWIERYETKSSGGTGNTGDLQPTYMGQKGIPVERDEYTFPPIYRECEVPSVSSASSNPDETVVFDLETAGAEFLHSNNQDFVRLACYTSGGEIVPTTNFRDLTTRLNQAERVVGHNIMAFDLIALSKYHDLDITALTDRDAVADTKLLAFLADPPHSRMNAGQVERYYSLDAVAERLGVGHKSPDLKELVKEFGSYDAIPVDDPRYIDYCSQDVALTAELVSKLPMTPYAAREHKIAAIAATITLNGFRVDTGLLEDRLLQGQSKKAELIEYIASLGMPLTDGKGKTYASPHTTTAGREAIKKAFENLGAEHMPQTASGAWGTSRDHMIQMKEVYKDIPEVVELAETIEELSGIRTIYQTITDHLVGDRVYPTINMRQSSGRWSVTNPGLTVIGKKNGRAVEREVFLPEEGHVLIAADLSQIDARAVAVLSQDEAYLELFSDPAKDSHKEVARMIWGDEEKREAAKACAHAWNYGVGIEKLAKTANVSVETAMEFDQTMIALFPRLVEWRNEMREIGGAGELLDNGFGRLMRCEPERAYTQAPALMGQGCARDLLMKGLLQLPKDIHPYIRGVIHDEIVLSAPIDIIEDVERTVVQALTFEWAPPGLSHSVSVFAKTEKRGVNWGDCY